MRDMMTYEFDMPDPNAPHPDMAMEVDISVDDPEHIYIFHDQPFTQDLSWIEYDHESKQIDFIVEDGAQRNFGVPVTDEIGQFLAQNNAICLVLRDGTTAVSHAILPLIMHQ